VREPPVRVELEVDDKARERSPSPSKKQESVYIHVQHLVRPYTINQLKALLQRSGTIAENGFWIDNIKSHCYVKFTDSAGAAATRQALHGLKWPSGNPKNLNVDFAENNLMWVVTGELLGEEPKIVEEVIEIEDKEPAAGQLTERRRSAREEETAEERRDRREKERNERESKRKERETNARRTGVTREARRPVSAAPAGPPEITVEEPPAKLLDDLFRKTVATPCIYWLPLTDQQVAEKEERAKQQKEQQEAAQDKALQQPVVTPQAQVDIAGRSSSGPRRTRSPPPRDNNDRRRPLSTGRREPMDHGNNRNFAGRDNRRRSRSRDRGGRMGWR